MLSKLTHSVGRVSTIYHIVTVERSHVTVCNTQARCRERWLAEMRSFLINTDGSIPALKTLPGKVIPQTLPRAARRVWGPDYTIL